MTSGATTGTVLGARNAVPAWWPARWYYGWAVVAVLGLAAITGYGALLYAFGAFIAPMSEELGWTKAQITGAFSLAQLVAGVVGIPVGRWVDRRGARGLMTAGAIAATALIAAWGRVDSLAAYYAIWIGLGATMAAVLYEPAFAVVATWFRRERSRALTVLTFVGGFASVIFVPLVTNLVAGLGWRDALLWLAVVYGALTVPAVLVVLRRRPEDVGLAPDAGPAASHPTTIAERSVPAREAVRSASFRWLTVAFSLSGLATMAVAVHLVALLQERGYGARFAGTAIAVLGLMALPGRLVFTPLGERWSRSAVTASIFVLSGFACLALLVSRGEGAVWAFVILFGAGFGAITPARAALVADLFGPASYGKISGVLALPVAFARAAAPVGASLLYAAPAIAGGARGYDAVLVALALLSAGSAGAVLLAGDGRARGGS